jgi:hypothetical protein
MVKKNEHDTKYQNGILYFKMFLFSGLFIFLIVNTTIDWLII